MTVLFVNVCNRAGGITSPILSNASVRHRRPRYRKPAIEQRQALPAH
jgi:hypothetical protein